MVEATCVVAVDPCYAVVKTAMFALFFRGRGHVCRGYGLVCRVYDIVSDSPWPWPRGFNSVRSDFARIAETDSCVACSAKKVVCISMISLCLALSQSLSRVSL